MISGMLASPLLLLPKYVLLEGNGVVVVREDIYLGFMEWRDGPAQGTLFSLKDLRSWIANMFTIIPFYRYKHIMTLESLSLLAFLYN